MDPFNNLSSVFKMKVNSSDDHVTTTAPGDEDNGIVWIPFAEPVPNWEEAKEKWGVWWHVHTYGIGVLFFIVSIFTLANIIALCLAKRLPQKAYFITLNAIILVFSTERAIFMFVDAYNIRGTLPAPVAYLFLSIGLPCMTSSFYLIFVAWIKATKMQKTNAVHKTKTMVIVIALHFAASLAFDLAAGFTLHAAYLLVCCQSLFVILGIVLSIMYFYLYVRIYHTTVKSRKDLVRMSKNCGYKYETPDNSNKGKDQLSSIDKGVLPSDSNYQNFKRRASSIPEAKIPLGAKLILATAILLFIIACLYMAGIFFCYTLQVIAGESPEPWSWWAYELALRLCEIGYCWTVSLAATRPITRRLAKEVSVRVRNSRRKLVQSTSHNIRNAPQSNTHNKV